MKSNLDHLPDRQQAELEAITGHLLRGFETAIAGGTEILIRFSEPMSMSGWSLVEWAPGSAPDLVAEPRFEQDGRALRLHARLAPGKVYAFWLNTAQHGNFHDLDGRPLIPYLLGFQTKGS